MRIHPFRAVLACLLLIVITIGISHASTQTAAPRFITGHTYAITTSAREEIVNVTVGGDANGWVMVNVREPHAAQNVWLNARLVIEMREVGADSN
jgi:hypothetical protein